MITIQLPRSEEYDSDKNEFIYTDGAKVSFEYSLLAISEWETKWKKPYLNSKLTDEELLDFLKCMALGPVDDDFFSFEVVKELSDYINDPHTATTFSSDFRESDGGGSNRGKVNTAESIYASMFAAKIPLEFESRNFNNLSTILRIISIANEPPKKMSKQDVMKQNASLNAQRKAAMNTKG